MARKSLTEETVDLESLLNRAIDAAERESIMVLDTMVGQLKDVGLDQQAEALRQALDQRIPVSAVDKVLSHWIVEEDLATI